MVDDLPIRAGSKWVRKGALRNAPTAEVIGIAEDYVVARFTPSPPNTAVRLFRADDWRIKFRSISHG